MGLRGKHFKENDSDSSWPQAGRPQGVEGPPRGSGKSEGVSQLGRTG